MKKTAQYTPEHTAHIAPESTAHFGPEWGAHFISERTAQIGRFIYFSKDIYLQKGIEVVKDLIKKSAVGSWQKKSPGYPPGFFFFFHVTCHGSRVSIPTANCQISSS